MDVVIDSGNLRHKRPRRYDHFSYPHAGQLYVSIMPPINHEAAVRIEKNIARLPGLSSVDAHSSESTIKFSVDKNAQVDTDQIRKTLEEVDQGAVMSTPVLDHAYSANPGL